MAEDILQAFDHEGSNFPVDFDEIWTKLGYGRKDNAVKTLQNRFTLNVDYIVVSQRGGKQGGRPMQKIFLTNNCVENFNTVASFRLKGPRSETIIRDALAVKLKGRVEVATLAGFIDILTPSEVIEVKDVKNWKGAIGQVLIYLNYYPRKAARIHLFGEADPKFKQMVEQNCAKLGVRVTWEI